MSVKLDWSPREFKAAVAKRLAENGEEVGHLVVQTAKTRLLAIDDPDWGATHRKYVAGRLTHVVESSSASVDVLFGVAPGPLSPQQLGFYIEVGSRTRPAAPYLRPAVFQNGRRIVDLLSGKG